MKLGRMIYRQGVTAMVPDIDGQKHNARSKNNKCILCKRNVRSILKGGKRKKRRRRKEKGEKKKNTAYVFIISVRLG